MRSEKLLERLGIPASLARRIQGGGLWSSVGYFGTTVFMLLSNVFLARLLMPNDLGAYFLAFSLVSVLSTMVQLGLPSVSIRLIAKAMARENSARARGVLTTSSRLITGPIILLLALVLLGAGPWFLRAVFHSEPLAQVIHLLWLWTVALALRGLLSAYFMGFHRIFASQFFESLFTAGVSALMFFGWWLTRHEMDLETAVLISSVVGAVNVLIAGSVMFSISRSLGGNIEVEKVPGREVLAISLPILAHRILTMLYMHAGIWVLGIWSTGEEIALFGAANRLAALLTMPLTIINGFVAPIIAEMYEKEEKKQLEAALRLMTTFAGMGTIALGLVYWFFGAEVLAIIFGDYYAASASILVYLTVGHVIKTLVGPCGMLLSMSKHEVALMYIALGAGTLGLLLIVVLGRTHGTIGVAIGVSAAIAFKSLMMLYFSRRLTGIRTHMSLSALRLSRSGGN